MKIAVTDANIFIDLIHLEMLGFLFDLDLEIHTTLEVYEQMNEKQKKVALNFVQSKLLNVYKFSIAELNEIAELKLPSGLEFADRTVFYYSTKINTIILSGDKKLKSYCEGKKLEVKGILWVFENFVSHKIVSPEFASEKMKRLISINDRLPIDECYKLITLWGDSQ